MKNLILFVATTLISLSAFSAAREFRINGYSAQDGYAIAWGIPGQLIDFEEIEKDPAKVDDLWNQISSMRNYLVDLQTNQILATIHENPDEIVAVTLGGMSTNHYEINTQSLGNYYTADNSYDLVGVFESFKWGTSLSAVFVVSTETTQPKVVSRIDDLEERMLNAAKASLTAEQVVQFEKGVTYVNLEDGGYDEPSQHFYKITWESEVPKSVDDPTVTVTAQVKFNITKNRDVNFRIERVQYSQED